MGIKLGTSHTKARTLTNSVNLCSFSLNSFCNFLADTKMPLSAAESSDVAAQAAAPASETSDGRSNSGEEEDGNSMTEQVNITRDHYHRHFEDY